MQTVNFKLTISGEDVAFLERLACLADRDRDSVVTQAVAEFVELQRWQVQEVARACDEQLLGDQRTQRAFAELIG